MSIFQYITFGQIACLTLNIHHSTSSQQFFHRLKYLGKFKILIFFIYFTVSVINKELERIYWKMAFVAEHVVFSGETRAIDFKYTSSNVIVYWKKEESLRSKPIALYFSPEIRVVVELRLVKDYHEYMSATAYFTNSSDQIKSFQYKLYAINLSSGKEEIIQKTSNVVQKVQILAGKCHSEQLSQDRFNTIFRSDNFNVIVRVEEIHKTKNVFSYKSNVKWNLPVGMFKDDTFKDVKFVVEGQSIMAHKSVLAHHSEVFRSMLTLDTKERNEGIIEITDTDASSFKAFIKYLYTNEIDSIHSLADDLIILADKYDVVSLRRECENYLCQTINETNVFSLLVTADLHNYQMLKKHAIFTIKSQLNKLSPYFPELQRYPHLVQDIFQSLADDRSDITTSFEALTLEK